MDTSLIIQAIIPFSGVVAVIAWILLNFFKHEHKADSSK